MKKQEVKFRKLKCVVNRTNDGSMRGFIFRKIFTVTIVTLTLLSAGIGVYGQDGIAGIQEANTKVRGYFAAGTSLMYAVGAILGLIGAIKVYQKWSNGHQDTGAVVAAWFGSCVFLVIVATVLKSFFGL